MFIKISRQARVFITKDQKDFLQRMSELPYFFQSQLDPTDQHIAELLADKSIFVRKKLDNNVQYALNKQVVRINREFKKTPGTGKTD